MAEKFKTYSGDNEAMILGQLLHTVFQGTLRRCNSINMIVLQKEALEMVIREEVKKTIFSLETLDRL